MCFHAPPAPPPIPLDPYSCSPSALWQVDPCSSSVAARHSRSVRDDLRRLSRFGRQKRVLRLGWRHAIPVTCRPVLLLAKSLYMDGWYLFPFFFAFSFFPVVTRMLKIHETAIGFLEIPWILMASLMPNDAPLSRTSSSSLHYDNYLLR